MNSSERKQEVKKTAIEAGLEYEALLNRRKELPEGFHFSDNFFHYERKPNTELYNWKFHISVQHEDVAKTYDLIVDILKKYFSNFKVISPDCPPGSRCYDEAQFTIYLYEEDEKNVEKVESALNELNDIMVKNGIRKGRIPKADAPLRTGEYFSLRNDGTRTFQRHDSEGYYFESDKVGRQYNPLRIPNPFASLLKKPDKPFELVSYFQEFQANTLIGIYQALACTCHAYVNSHGGVDKIRRDINLLTGRTIDHDEAKGILSISTNPSEIMAYMLAAILEGRPTDNFIKTLDKISLYDFYKIDDEFGKFLKYIDTIKKGYPRSFGGEKIHATKWLELFGGQSSSDLIKHLEYSQKIIRNYLEVEAVRAKL